MSIRVLDISEHNGYVDFEAIKDYYPCVILRLGYGKHIDDMFIDNYHRAKEVGLKVGIYHYSYALNREQATEEAEFVLDVLRENDIKPGDLKYFFFDIEDADNYKAKHGMPSNDEITAICSNFIATCNEAGYYVGIYASEDWLFNVIDTDALADYIPIWVARWDSDFDFTKNVVLWQYTCEEYFNGKYFDCSYVIR